MKNVTAAGAGGSKNAGGALVRSWLQVLVCLNPLIKMKISR